MSDGEPNLLDLLHCPQTHRPLLPVTQKWLDRLNARIDAGEVRTDRGDVVNRPIEDGLLTDDERFLYPIRDGIANLTIGDRIVLADD